MNDLTTIHATDVNAQVVNTNQINLTGGIYNGGNSITFTPITNYTNFLENVHIYKNLYLEYNNETLNVGQLLISGGGGGGGNLYPSITYDSSLNLTSFSGNLSFPSNSILSSCIDNSDFVTKATSQVITGAKQFSGTQIFSSIQLNDNLIVDGGGTTILNSNLALINFLSGTSTNINTRFNSNETNIGSIQLRISAISYNPVNSTTTFINNLVFPANSIASASISNTTRFIENTGNQTIGGQKTFNSQLIMNNSIRMDTGGLILNNNTLTIPNTTLQKLQFCSTISSDIQTQTTNNTNNIQTNTNNIQTNTNDITTNTNSINTLNTKTTDITYSSSNTTIANTTNVSNLLISATINGFSKGDFNNVITQCASLNANCQNQINSAQNKANSADDKAVNAQNTANSALALAGVANGAAAGAAAIATGAAATAAGAVSVNTTQQTEIDDLQGDVITLQVKTSQISYSPTTLRSTIGQTTNIMQLEIGELISGINQTTQDQITFAGLLRCNNRVEVNNTLELINNNNIIVEGIINQDNANPPNAGVNQFLAPTNFNGNVTISNTSTTINATTTNIGTNSVSNFNCNSTATFGGDVTMAVNKNLRLQNIVPILLEDIVFGGNGGVHTTDDVIFNMKITANQPLQINNTCQIGTTVSRNTLTSYTTTTILDANTGMTLTTPTIGITSPLVTIGQADATTITLNSSGVYIGRLLGTNYLYGTTYAGAIYATNLYSATGVLGMAGQVFQQF